MVLLDIEKLTRRNPLIAEACARLGRVSGTVGFGDIDICHQLIDWGIQFITGPSDWSIVKNKLF